MALTDTANITRMLYEEGIKGEAADIVAYEMLRAHSPELVRLIVGLVEHGYTPEMIASGMRQEARIKSRKPDEAQIANCMAVARQANRYRDRG